jgi:hypothetical protein
MAEAAIRVVENYAYSIAALEVEAEPTNTTLSNIDESDIQVDVYRSVIRCLFD